MKGMAKQTFLSMILQYGLVAVVLIAFSVPNTLRNVEIEWIARCIRAERRVLLRYRLPYNWIKVSISPSTIIDIMVGAVYFILYRLLNDCSTSS